MSYSEALLLGILQGITEFLPVSSSGHLVLFERSFGLHPDITLNVFLHLGTLGAIVAYYHKELRGLVMNGFRLIGGRLKAGEERTTLFQLMVATAITAVMGVFLEGPIGHLFAKHAGNLYLGGTFFVTFLLLTVLFFRKRSHGEGAPLSYKGAVLLGLVQGLAVFPGISRSGSTIVVALLLGMGGKAAARFSFLLAVPVIAGAGLLEARHLGGVQHVGPLVAGVMAAFFVGFASLLFLVKIVERQKMAWFALYMLPLSLYVAIWGR